MANGVADAGITHLFDRSGQKPDLARPQFINHFHLWPENTNAVHMVGAAVGHELNPFTLLQLSIDDPHQHDHPQIGIIPAIHQHCLQGCIDITLRCRKLVHNGFKRFNNPLARLSRDLYRLCRIYANHIFNLLRHAHTIGRWQINFIENWDNLMICIKRMVHIRERLRLNPL